MGSFRKRAGGGRRDRSEADIVEALRKAGARVFFIGGTGNPDLAAWFLDRPYLLEVKTGKGKRTENQQDIPWPVVNSPEQALAVILAPFGKKPR